MTLRLPGTCTMSAPLPRTTVLLDETTEPAPTAVAWSRPSLPTLALLPMIVLLAPAPLPAPALLPTNVLSLPDVLPKPACAPKNELSPPVALPAPALAPKNELALPAVLLMPAFAPTNELALPAVLICPAPMPANRLFPAAFNTRLPPRLYCVSAFNVLPESVPPAVPSPEILKFEDDCGLVLFWM